VRVFVPGFDRLCIFPPMTHGAEVQRLFWNQLEVWMDPADQMIRSRWIYWSLGSLLQHGLISGLVLLGMLGRAEIKEILLMLVLGNLIPLAVAQLEIQRVTQRIAPTLE
jgi:hypothetical protein